jgi:hypothetical protein
VMLINKDQNNDHDIRVSFKDPETNATRFFSGTVDRVVFGPGEYQWHPDPAPVTASLTPALPQTAGAPQQEGGEGVGRGRGGFSGHADPDGPASKSTVTATGPDTVFHLPKASIIVLRGKLAAR